MKKQNFKIKAGHLLVFIGLFCFACGSQQNTKESSNQEIEEQPIKQEITLTSVKGSPEYSEAALQLNSAQVNDSAVSFDFAVSNYELGVQTPDASDKGLANSDKGQHIHLIVDNGPYSAHYEPSFSKELEPGNHVVMAFLSRSYHESVKNANAFIVKEMKVGETSDEISFDETAPHMFYSRPKGVYSGSDTEKLLLDFYLLNTTLSPDGNKVRATINGTEFMIDEWAPYQIEGLSKGEVTIKLELIDADGNLIESPFNPVTRTVTLED